MTGEGVRRSRSELTMDAAALRRHFAGFLGEDRFREFVVAARRAGRLRYWQEQAWCRFAAAHPDYDMPREALLAALRVCELHAAELLPDEVPVAAGCIDYTERYVRARRDRFPNAAVGPVMTEGASLPGPTAAVWYCPDCRGEEARYRVASAGQSFPSTADLTRRTALEDYEAAWGYGSLAGRRRDRWQRLREEVEATLACGGELWEWESVGFKELAGVAGLAVVREASVVRHWTLAKS